MAGLLDGKKRAKPGIRWGKREIGGVAETHCRIQQEQLEDALLMRPQGSSFSEGGYEASVAYLNILRDEYNWMGEVT